MLVSQQKSAREKTRKLGLFRKYLYFKTNNRETTLSDEFFELDGECKRNSIEQGLKTSRRYNTLYYLFIALLRARNGWLYCTLAESTKSKDFPENIIPAITQLVKSFYGLIWQDTVHP